MLLHPIIILIALLAAPASFAEEQKDSPAAKLALCEGNLNVTEHYAAQQNAARNVLERELARLRAQNAGLQAKLKELTEKK